MSEPWVMCGGDAQPNRNRSRSLNRNRFDYHGNCAGTTLKVLGGGRCERGEVLSRAVPVPFPWSDEQ
jgi:hypothetical protein